MLQFFHHNIDALVITASAAAATASKTTNKSIQTTHRDANVTADADSACLFHRTYYLERRKNDTNEEDAEKARKILATKHNDVTCVQCAPDEEFTLVTMYEKKMRRSVFP